MRSEQHPVYSKAANFIDLSLKYEAKRRIHTNSSSVTHRDKPHCGGPTFNPLTAISAVIPQSTFLSKCWKTVKNGGCYYQLSY